MDTLRDIALDMIDESPTNPRKRIDTTALAELAASIAAKGLIAPVVVRPRGERYELVVGGRRFRASALVARSATISAIVRDLTDREVCEIQLEENGQRVDVHPLEEADAYDHLRRQGADVTELAARTGKSVTYVRQRLQYCALGPEAREAFFEGRIGASVALFLSRIPVPATQAQALADVAQTRYTGEAMSPREANEHIRRRYMLRLADAPFSRDDAQLVPTAGACGTCPKRTGAQPELFADVDSPDTCTDPECYAAKSDAHWKALTTAAKAKGQSVLSAAETKKVFSYGDYVDTRSDYVEINAKPYEFGGKKTYKSILKVHLPPIALARDDRGAVHELVRKDDLRKALKAAGITQVTSATSSLSADEKKRRDAQVMRRRVLDLALDELVTVVEGATLGVTFWRFVARRIVARGWQDALRVVAKRRRLLNVKAVADLPDSMSAPQLRALVVEVLCAAPPSSYGTDHGSDLREAAQTFGVDLKAFEQRAIAETKGAKAKVGAEAKGAKKASKKASKGAT